MSGPNHNHEGVVRLSLTAETVEAALLALAGAAADECEPPRFQELFARAAAEIRAARGEVSS